MASNILAAARWALAAVLFLAIGVSAVATPSLSLVGEDYLQNSPATNRFVFPSAFPEVERTGETFHAPAVVYRRGETIELRLAFYNPTATDTVGTFSFSDPVLWLGPTEILLSPTTQTSPITVPAFGTATVEVQISAVPDYVAIGSLFAKVAVDAEQGPGYSHLGDRYMMKVYLTDEEPVWPMTPVWLEVLDDSCSFGRGLSGASSIFVALPEGLYGDATFYYVGLEPQYYRSLNPTMHYYRLSNLIEDRLAGDPVFGDCRDVNGYLAFLLWSQGYGLGNWRLSANTPFPRGFRTNPIKPIGHEEFSSTTWAFHHIVGTAFSAFDACAAQSLDLYGAPGVWVPAAWYMADYWQKPYGTPPYLGLVFGFADQSVPANVPLGMTFVPSHLPT